MDLWSDGWDARMAGKAKPLNPDKGEGWQDADDYLKSPEGREAYPNGRL